MFYCNCFEILVPISILFISIFDYCPTNRQMLITEQWKTEDPLLTVGEHITTSLASFYSVFAIQFSILPNA